jgi:hypothetical protein
MPEPNEVIDDERVTLFDRLAALTVAPDASFDELSALYRQDERISVRGTVRNELLDRGEEV